MGRIGSCAAAWATNGAGTSARTRPGTRRTGCRRACRAACSTTSSARARCRRPTTSATRCEGVDYACTVFVDGDELASHEGLFAPFDVDVSKYADGAEHLLAVVVHAAPVSEPQVGHTSKVQVHKPRMNYGWDFCPRVVHQGIWRSVELVDGSDDPRPAAPRSVDF